MVTVAIVVLLVFASSAHAGSYEVQVCTDFNAGSGVFAGSSTGKGFKTANECGVINGGFESLEIDQLSPYYVLRGHGGQWAAATPSPLLQIVDAYTRPNAVRVDCALHKDGFAAQYFWGQAGRTSTQDIVYEGAGCKGGMGGADGINRTIAPSRYFGWRASCSLKSSCHASSVRVVLVRGVQLQVRENTGPLVLPVAGNVWDQRSWVRGSWPATVGAGDPSGICALGITVNGQPIVSPYVDPARDRSSFQQCHGSELPALLDTTRYPNGGATMQLVAINAAGVRSAPAKTILVDNAPVTLGLSGRTDAPSTAGTQYVRATATAGPSGVAIACSTDGSPYQWHLGASTAIPVQGVGQHAVTCWAQNSAVDIYGHPAVSTVQSWHMAIRVPTVATASFTKLVDRLKCKRETERVRIPGHWVKVRRHGKVVRVHRPARWVKKRVRRCHARVVRRRVRVHGRWRTVWVAVFPHLVQETVRRVPFGKSTVVGGWLGTTDRVALGGQVVHVLTAPDNGTDRFKQAAVVRTRPDGTWSARLAAGPCRLIEVLYAGSPTTEPSFSAPARLVVPARIKLLSVSPSRVAWGGTVRITGQLVGGYLPPGGALVRLRIGEGSSYQTYGVKEHVTGNGRFATTYTFGSGPARILKRFWFQIATLPMGDYPFAPAASGRRFVVVGGHPHKKEK